MLHEDATLEGPRPKTRAAHDVLFLLASVAFVFPVHSSHALLWGSHDQYAVLSGPQNIYLFSSTHARFKVAERASQVFMYGGIEGPGHDSGVKAVRFGKAQADAQLAALRKSSVPHVNRHVFFGDFEPAIFPQGWSTHSTNRLLIGAWLKEMQKHGVRAGLYFSTGDWSAGVGYRWRAASSFIWWLSTSQFFCQAFTHAQVEEYLPMVKRLTISGQHPSLWHYRSSLCTGAPKRELDVAWSVP